MSKFLITPVSEVMSMQGLYISRKDMTAEPNR